ncbi:hypothetical protein RAA17_04830 [Komagataeibacter rhaeticus]|nr:hypothetical protein [Komagataeibacter rhaeticus]
MPQGDGMDARIRIDMEQIDLARLMQAMGHNLHGQGIIGGHIVVHGHGRSLAQIVGNGDGGITMALDDGVIFPQSCPTCWGWNWARRCFPRWACPPGPT